MKRIVSNEHWEIDAAVARCDKCGLDETHCVDFEFWPSGDDRPHGMTICIRCLKALIERSQKELVAWILKTEGKQ